VKAIGCLFFLGSMPTFAAPPLVLTAREVPIGGDNLAYKDPEFWIEGRKVAWQDGDDQIWLADIDPRSGEWIPADGRGKLLGRAANIESDQSTGRPGSWNGPEWGFSQQGPAVYFTMIDGNGVNQQARYRLNTGLTEQITFGGNRGRSGTLPSKDAGDPFTRIMYFIGRFGTGQGGEAHWQWENDNSTEANLPATDWAFSGPQWIPGQPAIVTNQRDAAGVQQVARFETRAGNTATPEILTTDPRDKVDTYFFKAPEYGGELAFITLLDKQDIGVYRQIGGKWTLQRTLQVPVIPPPGSRLTVFSAEPFSFGGRSYFSFAITFGTAYQNPSWIYVMSIDGTYVEQVSDASNVARIDPEYFYTDEQVFIYYYTVEKGGRRRLYLSKLAPPAERLVAPTIAIAGAAGLTASVPAQAGATYTWRVDGGTITAGQGTPSVTFTADAAGKVVLACTATRQGTSTRSAIVVPVYGIGAMASVTVDGGYGAGSFPAGSRVDIWAPPATTGMLFDRWTGDTIALEDPTSAHTMLRVPAAGARVAAGYRTVSAWSPTTEANFGGAGVGLTYHIPANPRGLMFFFHGTGGGGANNFTKVETRLFFAELIAAGYGVAALDSTDRTAEQWNNSPSLTANPDLVNVTAAIARFRTAGAITTQTPLYFSGMSNGGAMAPRAAALLANATPAYPVAAAMSSCASGNTAIIAATTVPQLWNLQRNDDTIGDDGRTDAQTNFSTLLTRGVPTQLVLQSPSPVYPERFAALGLVFPAFTVADSRTIQARLKSGGYLDANDYLRDAPSSEMLGASLPAAYAPYAQEIGNLLNVSYGAHEFNGDVRRRALAFFNRPGSFYQPGVPADSSARLANLSARAAVGGGSDLIVGFVIEGSAARRVLVRGVGPALADFGVTATLARPSLTLFAGSAVQRTNAGWSSAPNAGEIAAATPTLGAFPLPAGSADTALLESFLPRSYTAHLGSTQFVTVVPVAGASYVWTVANGTIVSGQGTPVLAFRTAPVPGTTQIGLTVTTGGASATASAEVAVHAPGGTLTDTAAATSPAGTRLFFMTNFLRGERILIAASNAATLVLYDAQGRPITVGNPLDHRVPVRGSYFLQVTAAANGTTLTVAGVRPPTGAVETPAAVAAAAALPSLPSLPAMPPTAALNSVPTRRLRTSVPYGPGFATGEGLVAVGDRAVAIGYDYTARRSFLVSHRAGAEQWRTLTDDDSYLRSIAAGADGTVLVIGSTGGAGAASDAVLVALYESTGVRRWRREIATAGYDYGYAIAPAPDGGVFAGGFTSGALAGATNAGRLDSWIARYDAAGSLLWSRQFGTPGDDRLFAGASDASGNFIAFGDAETTPSGQADLFLHSYAPTGLLRWSRQFGTTDNDLAFACATDASGAIFVHGMTRGSFAPGSVKPAEPDVYLAKFDAAGTEQWRRQLGAAGGQSGETLATSPDGTTTLLFYTNGSFPGAANTSQGTRASDDMVLARFDRDGGALWLQQFDDTTERIFARGVALVGDEILVQRDHVYAIAAPFCTVSLDTLAQETARGRLTNLSVRSTAGRDSQTLIAGFALRGSGTTLLLRGVGPGLAPFGVGAPLADPQLSLLSGTNQIATNDDWTAASGASFSAVGAFALPAGSKDAALLTPLSAGSYTAQITGAGATTGLALAEVYDTSAATTADTALVNLSARAQVGTRGDILIAGFAVTGGPLTVLVRAVGPGLSPFGVTGLLTDPRIELFSGQTRIGENDTWSPATQATFDTVGAFALPAGSKDAALVATLAPGTYTAQVSGAGATTGVALVEVYAVPE
jgi:hypothetical protein